MDFLFRYQIEMVIAAVSLVALFIAALILDYLMTHNRVVRDDSRKEARLRAAKRAAARRMAVQTPREPAWALRLILLRAQFEKRFEALLEESRVQEGLSPVFSLRARLRAMGRALVEAFSQSRVERRRS